MHQNQNNDISKLIEIKIMKKKIENKTIVKIRKKKNEKTTNKSK